MLVCLSVFFCHLVVLFVEVCGDMGTFHQFLFVPRRLYQKKNLNQNWCYKQGSDRVVPIIKAIDSH